MYLKRGAPVVVVAIGVVIVLALSSACSSGLGNRSTTLAPASAQDLGKGPHPLVARQFPELADADWTIEKPLVGREIPCRNDKALIFDCHAVTLLAYLPEHLIGGEDFTGVWGWTDPATRREFVLAGQTNGLSFVETTDPLNPRYLGELPFHQGATPSHWRDVKVYRNYAFVVSDQAGPHGVQVFDLTQLRAVTAAPTVFQETAHYGDVASVHTIALDTATGFAYLAGSNGGGKTCGSGLHMVDLRTPTAPVFAGCYVDSTRGVLGTAGYIHEAECVLYHGPDRSHRNREVCFNASRDAVDIVDVTDKQHPTRISLATYPNVNYAHQGWLTDDQHYLFLDDELDELMRGNLPRTIVLDLQKLSDPVVAREFFGTTPSTDHNLYIRGRYVYQANYRAGLRVLDIKDPTHPVEVGYFDTTPMEENKPGLSGAWGNYPYFAQRGVVAVTTLAPVDVSGKPRVTTKGLFILRYPPAAAAN